MRTKTFRRPRLVTRVACALLLLAAAGHVVPAADLYEAGGSTNEARSLRAGVRKVDLNQIGKPPPRELEMRLSALLAKERAGESTLSNAELVQGTLKACADSGALWNVDASQRILCWRIVDRMLRRAEPAAVQPLRELQERIGGTLIQEMGLPTDESEADQLFESYPWAASTHERLIGFGETALREGRWDEALRAFHNAATYSANPERIAEAHVGSWFAIAEGGGNREALDAAMHAVQDNATLPWRGAVAPAAQVKQAIRNLLPPGDWELGSLTGLRRQTLRLPESLAADYPLPQSPCPVSRQLGPWPISRVERTGEALFVIGPRRVACYSGVPLALRWIQSDDPMVDTQTGMRASAVTNAFAFRPATLGTAQSSAVTRSPGTPSSPAIVCGLFFHNSRQSSQYEVSAFDAQAGRRLWRTRERPDWNNLEPLGDPAVAAGAVYIVATGTESGPDRPLFLMCLDARNGNTRWKTPLGRVAAEGDLRELSRLGTGVSVQERAVYVSTGLGLLARCRARDGAVEWVRTYPSALQAERREDQFRREGTAPLVVGNRLFVAPRDHSGILALEADTGSTLWESLLTPSDQVVGLAGTTLVVRAGEKLAGLDAASGKELWEQSVEQSTGAPAQLSGTQVFVLSRSRLVRVDATTGEGREELPLSPAPGAEYALLPDGVLLEMGVEASPSPSAAMAGVSGPPQVPLALDWSLPCGYPLLVVPAAGQGPTNTFGVLSVRTFFCVKTQPRCELAWRAILDDGADSIGFHGRRVVVASGRTLSALNAADGGLCWRLALPFDPQVVVGDDRALFAGDLTSEARVAAIDPETGRILWSRWFGQEPRFGNGSLSWIAMQRDPAGASVLKLYWQAALFGKDGWRPGVAAVDPMTGTIRDVQPFMPDEPQWPRRMIFGDSRTYIRGRSFLYGGNRAGFHREAISCIGKDSLARFFSLAQEVDLAPGWKRTVDPQVEGQYAGALGVYATSEGVYVKQREQVFAFDAVGNRHVVYDLPTHTTKTSRVVLDLRETGDALTVVSGGPPPPPGVDPRVYTFGGLKDDTGAGAATIRFFEFGRSSAQIGIPDPGMGFPEAGANPVATLLDGMASEAYHEQRMSMSNMNSLGWAKYDVFLYGPNPIGAAPPICAVVNGKDRQLFGGWDFKNPAHRTTFIEGVNYVKFTGVTGDAFSLEMVPGSFAALQVVDASAGTGPGRKAASLGVAWNGGKGGPQPNERVGAEVAGGYWYVIRPDRQHELYSKTHITGGFQDPVIHVDVFDRATGTLRQTQELPVAAFDLIPSFGDRQAVILDDAVVVADPRGVRLFRSSPASAATPPK